MKVTVGTFFKVTISKYTIFTLLSGHCLHVCLEFRARPQHSGQGRKGLVMVSSKLGWAGLQRAGYVEWRIQTLAVTFHLAISRSLPLLPAYNYTRYLFLHVFICIDNLSISRASNYGCVVRFEYSCFELTKLLLEAFKIKVLFCIQVNLLRAHSYMICQLFHFMSKP